MDKKLFIGHIRAKKMYGANKNKLMIYIENTALIRKRFVAFKNMAESCDKRFNQGDLVMIEYFNVYPRLISRMEKIKYAK